MDIWYLKTQNVTYKMITGARFKDNDGVKWWDKLSRLSAYYWVFNDGNGTGMCMTITYTPR